MSKKVINEYLSKIHNLYSGGDVREESYYPALAMLLEKMWKINFKKDAHVITIPKRTEGGNPDIVVKSHRSVIAGYVEAKAPLKNLDKAEASEQLLRYRDVFPNLLLTDFLEFRHYKAGHLIASIKLCLPEELHKPSVPVFSGRVVKIKSFFRNFMALSDTITYDYKMVAQEMARQTRFMRDEVVLPELMKPEEEVRQGDEYTQHIHNLFAEIKVCLIHGLSKKEFADLYAQTFTFGIFTASFTHNKSCDLDLIGRLIPSSNGLLKMMFHIIEMGIVPPQLRSCLEYILDIINKSRIKRNDSRKYANHIRNSINTKARGSVAYPLLHFYETFLSAYDPLLKQKKGVYYTPQEIVGFIVESIQIILIEKLNKPDGLADKNIKILDPAAGTGTFPALVIMQVLNEYENRYGKGSIDSLTRQYLLNNLYAFEGMMAPYAIGHLRMTNLLEMAGVHLSKNERFNLLITNTLSVGNVEQPVLPGMSFISEESRKADEIKIKTPVTVVLGNPPYSGHSTNPGKMSSKGKDTWIGHLIEDYKKINGQPLGEKNPKWLQDDYVKFIRFAQHMIDSNNQDEGVVGFITNHAYLDNPTFRGMRQSLMNSFDEIYILDLHGNALKKEKAPDGSVDENVFDIRQGVAISLFIKIKGPHSGCRVFHADLYGSRKEKYWWLEDHNIHSIHWQEIFPDPEFYMFTPVGKMNRAHYSSFVKITDIFPAYNVGIVTARDNLTIHEKKQDLWSTINRFLSSEESEVRSYFQLGPDTRDWQVKHARHDLLNSGPDTDRIVPILYRPFDVRYTYYTGKSRGFLCMPRPDIMPHMLAEDNIGLITVRQVAEGIFNHSLVTDKIIESRVTTSNKGIAYLFPLYLYLFQSPGKDPTKHLNMNPLFLKRIEESAGFQQAPTPKDVFDYIYAILFSGIYREAYAEGLKIDFPRIPLPPSIDVFKEMAALGHKLAGLHLMPDDPGDSGSRFEVEGSNKIQKIQYHPIEKRVFINRQQYFSMVEPESWDYKLGGYQVLKKWISMRKNRILQGEEIAHYLKVIHIIHLSRLLEKQIDNLYPSIDGKINKS